MYLIILALVLIIIGFVLQLRSGIYSRLQDVGITLMFFGGCILIAVLIVIPISRWKCSNEIAAFREVQRTVQEQRTENISEVERANLTNRIIESNQWLVVTKRNSHSKWIGIYYSEDVNNLEPIK